MDVPEAMDIIPRCSAKSKQSGERCKRRPVRGAAVCTMHGGKAPQVQLKAAQRLAALIDPHLPVVAKRIQQGLYAMETKLFQKDGVVTDKRNLVNWAERRASAELAMRAMGIIADKDAGEHGPIVINVVYAQPKQEGDIRTIEVKNDE